MKSSENLSIALATPSYVRDYERCKILVESVRAFSQRPLQHYIIVDRRDYDLFKPLASLHTEVLTVESLLPPWIRRLPFISQAWLSLKTPPLRNWILQQLVKISLAQTIKEPVTVFVDSDVSFIRPFDLSTFSQQNKIRLFRVPHYTNPDFDPMFESAYRFLGLEGYRPGITRPNYIGNLISWRRDNVIAMCDHIQQVTGYSWIETLARSNSLSEYILYGLFVDQVLGENAGHFYNWSPLCHEYWTPERMDDRQLRQFFAAAKPENIAVMISAKSGIAPQHYAPYLKQYGVAQLKV